jgi:cobalt/nickel transport system permease protein
VGSRLWVIAGFLALIWVVLPVTFNGDSLLTIGPLDISYQGIELSAQITLKSIAILFVMIALTTTMSIATMGHALDRLKVPGKIVHLLLISYRYVFVIEQEYKRIVRAAKIRGFSPGTNLHTYRTVAYMLGMLFVRAALRADRVYQAMLLRGFHGRFYCLSQFPAHRRNRFFAILMTCLLAGFCILEWGPGK